MRFPFVLLILSLSAIGAATGCAVSADAEDVSTVASGTEETAVAESELTACANLSGTYRVIGCNPVTSSAYLPVGTPDQAALLETGRLVTIKQTACTSLEVTREVRERESDGYDCQVYGDCPFTGNYITDTLTVKPKIVWNSYHDERRTTSIANTGLLVVDENFPAAGYEKKKDTTKLGKSATGLTLSVEHWSKSTSFFSRNVPPTITTESCTLQAL